MSHTRAQAHLERLADRLGCRVIHDQDSPCWSVTHKESNATVLVYGKRRSTLSGGWHDDDVATWIEVLDVCLDLHNLHNLTPEGVQS